MPGAGPLAISYECRDDGQWKLQGDESGTALVGEFYCESKSLEGRQSVILIALATPPAPETITTYTTLTTDTTTTTTIMATSKHASLMRCSCSSRTTFKTNFFSYDDASIQ